MGASRVARPAATAAAAPKRRIALTPSGARRTKARAAQTPITTARETLDELKKRRCSNVSTNSAVLHQSSIQSAERSGEVRKLRARTTRAKGNRAKNHDSRTKATRGDTLSPVRSSGWDSETRAWNSSCFTSQAQATSPPPSIPGTSAKLTPSTSRPTPARPNARTRRSLPSRGRDQRPAHSAVPNAMPPSIQGWKFESTTGLKSPHWGQRLPRLNGRDAGEGCEVCKREPPCEALGSRTLTTQQQVRDERRLGDRHMDQAARPDQQGQRDRGAGPARPAAARASGAPARRRPVDPCWRRASPWWRAPRPRGDRRSRSGSTRNAPESTLRIRAADEVPWSGSRGGASGQPVERPPRWHAPSTGGTHTASASSSTRLPSSPSVGRKGSEHRGPPPQSKSGDQMGFAPSGKLM